MVHDVCIENNTRGRDIDTHNHTYTKIDPRTSVYGHTFDRPSTLAAAVVAVALAILFRTYFLTIRSNPENTHPFL